MPARLNLQTIRMQLLLTTWLAINVVVHGMPPRAARMFLKLYWCRFSMTERQANQLQYEAERAACRL